MGEGGGGEGGGGVESSDGRGGGHRAAACQSVCGGRAPGHLGIFFPVRPLDILREFTDSI